MSKIKRTIAVIVLLAVNVSTYVYASNTINKENEISDIVSENILEENNVNENKNDENNTNENKTTQANEENQSEEQQEGDKKDNQSEKQKENEKKDIQAEEQKNKKKNEINKKATKNVKIKSISFNYEHTATLNSKQDLRKRNDNSSKKIITIEKGKKVRILEFLGSYCKVQLKYKGKKYQGYIKKKHLNLESNIKMVEGNIKKLKPTIKPYDATEKFTYKSSNKNSIVIDKNGNMTAKKPGISIITVKTESKKEDYVIVEVKTRKKLKRLEVENTVFLKVGESYKLKYGIYPNDTTDKIYWEYNSKTISISKNGKIKAKKAGCATIYLKSESGQSVSTKVYIVPRNTMKLNKKAGAISAEFSNVKKINYGKSVRGENLEAYEIKGSGNNSKVIFIESAVHGFEDEYPKDGKVLVGLSNKLIEYYANNPNKLKDYTMVIVPCANPDGTLYGKNNYREEKKNAFGRCTYKNIDINRDFSKKSFRSKESRALKKLMTKYSKKMKVQLDLHGWEDSVLGDKFLVKEFRKYVGNKVDKTNKFGGDKGYIIEYTRSNFKVHSALVEFKNSKSVKANKVQKALNSIMKKL